MCVVCVLSAVCVLCVRLLCVCCVCCLLRVCAVCAAYCVCVLCALPTVCAVCVLCAQVATMNFVGMLMLVMGKIVISATCAFVGYIILTTFPDYTVRRSTPHSAQRTAHTLHR